MTWSGVALAQSPAGPSSAKPATELQGAGASFPAKVYAQWAQTYQRQFQVTVRYQATGSGAGVEQITARRVDFGGTDTPLSREELAQRRLIQVPMLVGGIVPVVKLPGVGSSGLQLTGEVLADLMQGAIARWDDPRIRALNPGVSLPALPVHRVVRADKSGTTEGYTHYLSLMSERFKQAVGSGPLPPWKGAVESVQGNDGIAQAVKRTDGALSYVSYDRVLKDGLTPIRLKNADGAWVSPSEDGFRAAIRASNLHRKGDDEASLIQQPGLASWPITQVSFILIDAAPAQAAKASDVMRYVYWCFMRGDELTRNTGFSPLPAITQSRVLSRLTTVRAQDGQALDFIRP